MHESRSLALGAVLLAVVALLAPGTNALAANNGFVRVAHLSPDAPAVDVYVDGSKALSSVPFKAVSDYLPLAAGSHELKVTAAGQSAAVITATADVTAGAFATVAAIGPLAQIKGVIFADNLSTPPSGQAKIRAVHAAVGAPSPVDVLANGKAAFTGLAFGGATEYAAVPAGTYTLGVAPPGSTNAAFSASATLAAGNVYTAFAIGDGKTQPFALLLKNDTAGAGMARGAAAGEGGLARPPAPTGLILAIVVLALSAGAGATWAVARARA